MILYDVMAEGFHTPLTREEIAELYQSGRIRRDSPCKLAVKLEWRTIDEVFPLLKHHSCWDEEPSKDFPSKAKLLVVAGCAAAVLAAAGFLAVRSLGMLGPWTASAPMPQPAISPAINPHRNGFPTAPPRAQTAPLQARQGAPTVDLEAKRQEWERQRLAREQQQRNQAANAERTRQEFQRREAERQRAAGIDTITPLDTYSPVNVGGWSVSVKVHDNDVTTFDIWINGSHHRDVKKQKGITGSRTDETLVYRNGRAALYYVWELSGKLNHCRLRVRDS